MNTRDGSDSSSSRKRAKTVPLSKELQQHLGGKLRAVYGQIVQEPVPERFSALLKKLSESEAAQSPNKTAANEEPQS
jgi:hypothetical protein